MQIKLFNHTIVSFNKNYICYMFSNTFLFKVNIIFLLNFLLFTKQIFSIYFNIRRYFTFTGKIFRLRFFKNKIKFIFNRSHRTFMYFNKSYISITKLNKKKYKIIFSVYRDYSFFSSYLNRVRRLNIFTWRGIKYSNKFYNKKQGKLSSYKRGISY